MNTNKIIQPTIPGAIDKTSGTPSGFPDFAFEHDGTESNSDPTLTLIAPWNLKIEGDVAFGSDLDIDGDLKIDGSLEILGSFNFLPAGIIFPYTGSTAPSGFLLCNGASVLRASNTTLYAVIGTTYGSVDLAHFNVPDYRGVFLRGAGEHGSMTKADGTAFDGGTVGSEEEDKMQQITGSVGNGYSRYGGNQTQEGAISVADYVASNQGSSGSSGASMLINFDSDNSLAQGGARTGDETSPASISVNYIIKT